MLCRADKFATPIKLHVADLQFSVKNLRVHFGFP